MSIAMQDVEKSSLELIREERLKRPKRPVSDKRIEANRRNAKKSTGPRTVKGKTRVAKNALKHGLCARLSCLPSECAATFELFVQELEQEFQPRTAMQRIVFNQIANLIWRLDRLPEAQTKLFAEETPNAQREDGTTLNAADVLARRFSADPTRNSFLLMDRYERSMRNSVLRLTRQFDQLKKHRATVPYDDNEPPVPVEMAWDEKKAEAQRRAFAEGRCVAPKAKLATDGAPMGTDKEEGNLATDGAQMSTDRDREEGEEIRKELNDLVCEATRGNESTTKPNTSHPLSSVSIGAPSVATHPTSSSSVPICAPSVATPSSVTAKQTQSNPSRKCDSKRPAGNASGNIDAPATKQSQARDAFASVASSERHLQSPREVTRTKMEDGG